MRISDWSSDVCSSDLKRLIGEFSRDADSRKSQRLNFTALQQLEGLIIQRAVLHLPRVGGPADLLLFDALAEHRSEEHTSELQSLMRISYAVFCLKKKNEHIQKNHRRSSRRQNDWSGRERGIKSSNNEY